ncbi:Rv1355c family protein [Dyadobacter tibetensis]|uniref:Rv1355c family protein n=1 Tax=Dyadobacter tibetensis TaxID=1211851 RepID=UPI0004715F97|nr:Rv1355c family protein [Dyadobacter tibetensis]
MQLNKNPDYLPQLFPHHQGRDSKEFWLLNDQQELNFLDLFENQKKELFKIKNPKRRFTAQQLDELYMDWASRCDVNREGTWVYYPWSRRMLRILDEAEFIQLRTSRNQHKITASEQSVLKEKTIGIIGLSVGNAVAMTLAIERIGGHLKLADFDELELSNLNRIRTGLHHLGLNKAIVTAREIAEIDPYLKVTCYTEGITASNIDTFLGGDDPIDLLIDECDDLQVKILARLKAKAYRLPLVMETSDRGMLDIERFDLDPALAIFHGKLADLSDSFLREVPAEHKMALIMRIIDAPNTSARGRASLIELGQTIGTWPQLASAVAMGGGVVADISRKILLNQHSTSGRFYVDLDEILPDKAARRKKSNPEEDFPQHSTQVVPTGQDGAINLDKSIALSAEEVANLTTGLIGLPQQVTGLNYHWYWDGKHLHLIIDPGQNNNFAHFHNLPGKILLGITMHSLQQKALQRGLMLTTLDSHEDNRGLIHHTVGFSRSSNELTVDIEINRRRTYFLDSLPALLSANPVVPLGSYVLPGSPALSITWITDPQAKAAMDRALGRMRALMILNPHGHSDFFARAIITEKEGLPKFPGFEFDEKALTAFSMIADYKSAAVLKSINGGELFTGIFTQAYQCKLAYLQVDLPDDPGRLGSMLVDLFHAASDLGLTVEPLCFPTTLSNRSGTMPEGMDSLEQDRLIQIHLDFCKEASMELSFDQSLFIRIAYSHEETGGQRQLQKLNFVIDTTNPTHE